MRRYSGNVMISESQKIKTNEWITAGSSEEWVQILNWWRDVQRGRLQSFTPTKDAEKQQFIVSDHNMTPKFKEKKNSNHLKMHS